MVWGASWLGRVDSGLCVKSGRRQPAVDNRLQTTPAENDRLKTTWLKTTQAEDDPTQLKTTPAEDDQLKTTS